MFNILFKVGVIGYGYFVKMFYLLFIDMLELFILSVISFSQQ